MKEKKSTQIWCRVTPECKKNLGIIAEQQNTKASTIVRQLVEDYINSYGEDVDKCHS